VPPTAAAIDADTDLDGLPEGPAVLVQAGAGEETIVVIENLALRRAEVGLQVETAGGGVADVTLRRALVAGGGTGRRGLRVESAGETRLRLDSVMIVGHSGSAGAGVFARATAGVTTLELEHVTISGNASPSIGGGIFVRGETSGVVSAGVDRSIVRGNTAGGLPQDVLTEGDATVVVERSDIGVAGGNVLDYGGTINQDPVFVNPAQGDCHLNADSPCVDAGGTTAGAGTDIDGNARPQGLLSAYDLGADERVDAVVAKVALLGPKGGEQLLGGETVNITWAAPAAAVKFALYTSTNNGATWRKIPVPGVLAGRHYAWTPPAASKNVSYRVKVVQQSATGRTVASSVGAKFTVGALRILPPEGGERVTAGAVYPVRWRTAPGKAVTGGKLYLSTDGGATWRLQTAATFTAGAFDNWTVPAATAAKTRCRVRVDLFNGAVKVGTDTSNANFTIAP